MGVSEILAIVLLREILLEIYLVETWKNFKAMEVRYMFGEIQT